MADDSWDIEQITDFHPCNQPYGTKDYILKDLTDFQQIKLNERKRQQIISDHKYLAKHPEIRGVITMILRFLMKEKPKYDIQKAIGRYFLKPSVDIRQEIEDYIHDRTKIISANSILEMKERMASICSRELELRDLEAEIMKIKELQDESTIDLPEEKDRSYSEKEELVADPIHKICQDILQEILDTVHDEVASFGTIASVGFPVDYDDHDIGTLSDSSDSDNDDVD